MKTILLAAAAALSLAAATAAHAQEGAGDPFAFRAPGLTAVTPSTYAADTRSAAYPASTGRPSQVVAAGGADLAPATGSEGVVQTANSLPRGFEAGTVTYAQAPSVRRYLAQPAAGPTRPDRTAQALGGAAHG